jgi:hypothetical protein
MWSVRLTDTQRDAKRPLAEAPAPHLGGRLLEGQTPGTERNRADRLVD